LNVALTRAKARLFVIASPENLRNRSSRELPPPSTLSREATGITDPVRGLALDASQAETWWGPIPALSGFSAG